MIDDAGKTFSSTPQLERWASRISGMKFSSMRLSRVSRNAAKKTRIVLINSTGLGNGTPKTTYSTITAVRVVRRPVAININEKNIKQIEYVIHSSLIEEFHFRSISFFFAI